MSLVNEPDLIRRIERLFTKESKGLLVGIGDDCAIFRPKKGYDLLATTDTLTEGVHFKRSLTTPKLLGGKSAEVNLSDIAAMGALPKYLLLSISFTSAIDDKWMKDFLGGFRKSIEAHDCVLIGGNVSASGELSFTVTAIGEAPRGEKGTRNGARPGDYIFITGTPGDSALGLDILLKKKKPYTRAETRLVMRHNLPTARVKWGRQLVSGKFISAMIDISDGVALDLSRLLEASGHGASIDLALFPLSREALGIVSETGQKGWEKILGGGEDYELLFTVRPNKAHAVRRLIDSGKIVAACIGRVMPKVSGGAPITITGPGGLPFGLKKAGWLHR
ncbi:Thiamine-monophosphate kinase [hydrothermal vent metagenome]|uniref:Thiamine-monophosphate kinase n=1 Tax=hydrothermal vent metagenome TaxID=652676 RepID=A0A3B1CAV9_9ZZZZ